ncbi:MAG: hypothetical protein ACU85U_01875 [Gammaproteobacteria bacterium]
MPHCPRCGECAGSRWINVGPALLCAALWAVPVGFLMLGMYPFGLIAMIVATWWAVRRVQRVCAHCGADRAAASGTGSRS